MGIEIAPSRIKSLTGIQDLSTSGLWAHDPLQDIVCSIEDRKRRGRIGATTTAHVAGRIKKRRTPACRIVNGMRSSLKPHIDGSQRRRYAGKSAVVVNKSTTIRDEPYRVAERACSEALQLV